MSYQSEQICFIPWHGSSLQVFLRNSIILLGILSGLGCDDSIKSNPHNYSDQIEPKLIYPREYIVLTFKEEKFHFVDIGRQKHRGATIFMLATELTQNQWLAAFERKPWEFDLNVPDSGRFPAVYISWHDATNYCAFIGKALNLTVRLPSAEEWENACLGGRSLVEANADWRTKGWFRNSAPAIGRSSVQPVASLKPSPKGFYDMLGNATEWVLDAPSSDPDDTFFRELKGGAWSNYPKECGCNVSPFFRRDDAESFTGFRFVLEAKSPTELLVRDCFSRFVYDLGQKIGSKQ